MFDQTSLNFSLVNSLLSLARECMKCPSRNWQTLCLNMAEWDPLLFFSALTKNICLSFLLLLYWQCLGNGETQIDEFWQASGGRFSNNLPSVSVLLFQSSELRLRLR